MKFNKLMFIIIILFSNLFGDKLDTKFFINKLNQDRNLMGINNNFIINTYLQKNSLKRMNYLKENVLNSKDKLTNKMLEKEYNKNSKFFTAKDNFKRTWNMPPNSSFGQSAYYYEFNILNNNNNNKILNYENIMSNPFQRLILTDQIFNIYGLKSSKKTTNMILGSKLIINDLCSGNSWDPFGKNEDKVDVNDEWNNICFHSDQSHPEKNLTDYTKLIYISKTAVNYFKKQSDVKNYPYKDMKNVPIYSKNNDTYKYYGAYSHVLGYPITISINPIKIMPEKDFPNVHNKMEMVLYETKTKKPLKIKILNSNKERDLKFYNNSFIVPSNNFIIIPLNLLKYGTEYTVAFNLKDNTIFDKNVKVTSNNLYNLKPTKINNITYRFNFKTKKLDGSILYLDKGVPKSFKVRSYKNVYFVSKNLNKIKYNCFSDTKNTITKKDDVTLKINGTKNNTCNIILPNGKVSTWKFI